MRHSLSAILAPTIVALGCASSPEPAPVEPVAAAAPTAVAPTGPVAAASLPAPAPLRPAAAPQDEPQVPEGGGPAEERLRVLEREKSVKQQEAEQVIRNYINSARRSYQENRPQAARRDLLEALKVQGHAPASEGRREAEEFLGQVEQTLGIRGAEIKTVPEILEQQHAVKVQEARMEVQNLLGQGKRLYAAKEFPDAIEAMERVLEVVRWAPRDADLTGYAEQARAYVKSAEDLKEREAQRRLKLKEMTARREALQAEVNREEESQRRLTRLFHEAVSRYESREYEKAQALCRKILELEPGHMLAQQLLADSSETAHAFRENSYHRSKVEEWKRVLEDFEATQVPYNEPVNWPTSREWQQTTRRAGHVTKASGTTLVAEDPRVKAIRGQLATKKINLDFEDAPFPTVINYIKTTSGVNLVVDKAVLEELAEARVNLKLEDLPVQAALGILLDFQKLTATFKSGVLYITKPEQAVGEAVLEIHDIRDLTYKVGSFPGPKIELKSGSDAADAGGLSFTDEGGAETTPQPEELVDLIKQSVAAESWAIPGRSITQIGGQLLVKQSPEAQAEIRNLLKDLRQFSGVLVAVEARFLLVSDDFLEDVGVDFRGLGNEKGTAAFLDDVTVGPEDNAGGAFDNAANGNPTQPPSSGAYFNDNTDGDYRGRTENIWDRSLGNTLTPTGGLNAQFAYINDIELNAILHAVKKTRRATLLTAPRLVAFNTQRSNVQVLNQIAYIRDFEVEVAQTAAIADPIIGVIQDGVVLDVKPTVSNDRKFITLDLRPTVATLVRPIPTILTNLGQAGSTQVNIQLPELRVQGAETTVRIPDGGTVVIGGLKQIRDVDRESSIPLLAHIPILNLLGSRKGRSIEKSNLILIVHARVIDLEEADGGPK
ncbi:MAG: hypothetical protein L0216_13660 [Planctomycetales bacterium]|nr:hypothetical protein [Planctomycetales bacterium]